MAKTSRNFSHVPFLLSELPCLRFLYYFRWNKCLDSKKNIRVLEANISNDASISRDPLPVMTLESTRYGCQMVLAGDNRWCPVNLEFGYPSAVKSEPNNKREMKL
ncbi:hypothetical protein ACLB2K_016972 [Fragaria x ananassa]